MCVMEHFSLHTNKYTPFLTLVNPAVWAPISYWCLMWSVLTITYSHTSLKNFHFRNLQLGLPMEPPLVCRHDITAMVSTFSLPASPLTFPYHKKVEPGHMVIQSAWGYIFTWQALVFTREVLLPQLSWGNNISLLCHYQSHDLMLCVHK